jgi:hypothetical protein
MIVKPVSELDMSDIQALVGSVSESRYIDFKQSVVGRADADRKEFVADVTAFANAAGGHIVFGVVEGPDAVAVNIVGLIVADRDEEERRLSDMIRNGTEPRLSDFEFKWIDDPSGSSVLVLHVPRSWQSPHRVTLAGHNQFYIRNSRGKHPMNTDELRTAFTYGRALEENIARFREARTNMIRKQEAPIAVDAGPQMVVHGMPLVSFADPPAITFAPRELLLSPLGGGGYNKSYALEGTVTHQPNSMAYTLHFRNGIVEGVMPARSSVKPTGYVPVTRLEMVLGEALGSYLRYWGTKSVRGPYVFAVSLLNVRNNKAIVSGWSDEAPAIRRDDLEFPSQVFNEADVGIGSTVLLRPSFDLMWNAFGHPGSPNYDNSGQYRVAQ